MRYDKTYWIGILIGLPTIFLLFLSDYVAVDLDIDLTSGAINIPATEIYIEGITLEEIALSALSIPILIITVHPLMYLVFAAINRKNKREAAVSFGLPESETWNNAESPMEMLRRTGIEK